MELFKPEAGNPLLIFLNSNSPDAEIPQGIISSTIHSLRSEGYSDKEIADYFIALSKSSINTTF